jgi:hypothetical protein
MPGHIVVRCNDCDDELPLSEDVDLVITRAELIVFTAAHDGHVAFDIQVRISS